MSVEERGTTGMTITNWSRTFSCRPEMFFVPQTLDELRDIILAAKAKHRKVRVWGRGHSPSDIAMTSNDEAEKGYLVSMRCFNAVLNVDRVVRQVKVECGITLRELNVHLDKHYLALNTLGSVDDVTLGGAISVGTHGSGIRFGNISNLVVEMEILTSTGDIIKCSTAEKVDIFRAACVGLGAFGIILNVTLQCDAAHLLESHSYPAKLHEVLEDLDEHLAQSDHFRFLYFPHTNSVSVTHLARAGEITVQNRHTAVPKQSLARRLWQWVMDYAVGYYTLEFAYYLSTYWPPLVPLINRATFALLYGRPKHSLNVSHKLFLFECLFAQYVNEWSIPKEKTGTTLLALKQWIETEATAGRGYAHFPLEVRFVKGDENYLSPAYGRDSCYINIISYRPYGKSASPAARQKYWDAYERIMKEAGGRPHWAKAHRETSADFIRMYPYFRSWCHLRKRLDPMNMFINPYLERILEPGPPTVSLR